MKKEMTNQTISIVSSEFVSTWFDNTQNNQIAVPNIKNEKNLIEKTFTGFGNYSINNDPSSDGIDNDNDGILDENDDDEFGDSRELAINIAINKIASDVVNSILSTW